MEGFGTVTKNINGEYNNSHPLLEIKEVPPGLVALRGELIYHADIVEYAQEGTDFSDCLGRIAVKLDIVLDGFYDVEPLCSMLTEALRNRRFFPKSPHLRHRDLVDVELVEKEGSLEIVERDRNVATIIPEEAIIMENDHSRKVSETRVIPGPDSSVEDKSSNSGEQTGSCDGSTSGLPEVKKEDSSSGKETRLSHSSTETIH